MTRYIIEEERAIWIREFHEVEADNEDEAQEACWDGGGEYLGHSFGDSVESLDTLPIAVTQMNEGVPFMTYPVQNRNELTPKYGVRL